MTEVTSNPNRDAASDEKAWAAEWESDAALRTQFATAAAYVEAKKAEAGKDPATPETPKTDEGEKDKKAPAFKLYKVEGGVLSVGLGAEIGLTAEQFKPRAGVLEEVGKSGKRIVCRVMAAGLQFKAGEEVAFASVPKESAHVLAPAKAGKKS